MNIKDIITQDLIELDALETNKQKILYYMANKLLEMGYVKSSFPQAIQDREAHYPSALPFEKFSVAIPHTDAIHVHKSAIFFIRLKNTIAFQVMGDPQESTEVKFVSMFALKDKNEIGTMLTSLITSYQNNQFLESLHNASTLEEAYNTFIDTLSNIE